MTDYSARVLAIYKKTKTTVNTPKYRALAYKVVLVLSILLLLVMSTLAGFHASNAYSTDSNSIVPPQQFGTDMELPVTVPGPHANLLKLPLFFVQGHLPYHYTNFTIGNVALVVITMLAWAFLLIKLFGRRYEIPILIFLSSLIFTSVIFSLSLGYTSIRNIEYPIALWFVFIVSDLLKKKRKYSRRQLALAITGSVLFSVTLAGDSFFNYATLVPLLLVLAWYWAQSREFTLNMLKAIGLIIGVVVGAALLKLFLSATGVLYFNYAFWGQNTIIPTGALAPSLSFALQQLMDLQGGNIFGQVISSRNLSVFVNFGFLLLSVFSLVLILIKTNLKYRKKTGLTANNNFIFATMAVSYFVIFFIYILSGYVITTLPNGQIISVENTRYISFMPFIASIGIFWLIKNYYKEYKALIAALCALLLLCIAVSYSSVTATYKSGIQLELAPSRASIEQIIDILETNDVDTVLADYWYGPVISFWSDKAFKLAEQQGCSTPPPSPTSKAAQFTRQKNLKEALIVDRGGLNYAYWTCTNEQVEQTYGTPSKKLEVPGVTSTPVEIWIYE